MDGAGARMSLAFRTRTRQLQVMLNQKKIKARRKKRKELFLGQICLMGFLLLVVSCFSCLAEKSGYDIINYTTDNYDRWSGRRLMQEAENNETEEDQLKGHLFKNCTEPGCAGGVASQLSLSVALSLLLVIRYKIYRGSGNLREQINHVSVVQWHLAERAPLALHEFPTDLFSHKERREGAIALHVFCAMYMFYALALVCDDYFVPSLDKICERLHLSEDVAGATFMAAGSSAPELFTSVIGVFITKGDVGVGTIVGSAVFNILCIIGVCGVFAGQAVTLSCYTLLRDSAYYTLSVAALIVFIHDEKVSWWESLVLISMYLVYILIMKFNSRAQRYFERRKKSAINMINGTANNADMDDNTNCDATVVLLKKGNFHRKTSVLMVDELLSAYPHQLSFSEAGLRVMITSHFPARTRLTMASRMLITERQRLVNNKTFSNGDSEVAIRIPNKHSIENGLGMGASSERGMNGHHGEEDGMETGNETENENEDNENNENDEEEEEEDDDDGPFLPFDPPAGICNRLKWLIAWPLCLLLYFTVPNCGNPRWEKWFMVTFITSTMWIACFSYVMVWMVTVIGYTLGVPDVIMGITFLAAGTSVPDCMASLIVARQGMGDMAVSNSIGSNVFDILVGLGLPWTLQTLAIDYGSYIHLNSKGLIFSVGLLLASVFLTVLGVHLNKWILDKKLGFACLFMYAIFLCFSIMIEFNVFTFVNLPMCRDH